MSGRSPICRNALFVEELRQPHPEHALQETCAAIPLPREPTQAMPWRIERQSHVRILLQPPDPGSAVLPPRYGRSTGRRRG